MTLRNLAVLSLVLAAAVYETPAGAQQNAAAVDRGPGKAAPQSIWKCRRGDARRCSSTDLSSAYYRQILVMPSGYTKDERDEFWADFDTFASSMSNTGSVWSTQKRDQILYIGYFVGGGPLGTPEAAFDGAITPHPIRDYALSLSLDAVFSKVASIQATEIPELKPMGVQVILNDFQSDITANAAPPNFLAKSYGIAKMTRGDLETRYVGSRELGHAALNFLDEYVEAGFEDLDIRSLDVATPLVLFDGSWNGATRAVADRFGTYDYNISEILANNGNHNIATSSRPSTVTSPISNPASFPYEGGMFFGRGTFHAAGNNLMNSNHVMRAADDGFALAHSASQEQVIEIAFGATARRANDRLRNAGPKNGWGGAQGSTPTLLMFDGDKNHHFQPTAHYSVQVGWYERVWATCYSRSISYPCSRNEWRTVEKTIYPAARSIELKATSLYGLANLTQSALCAIGVTEVPKPDGSPFRLCEQPLSTIAEALLPTFAFRTPYEETTVPANQPLTTYYWRFSTYNGHVSSGWTGWSSFYRSF